MPANRTKHTASGLGKALINRKAKEAVAPKDSQLYLLDDTNPLASVTHERDLDEFLANAALADADFTTERSKIRIVQSTGIVAPETNPFLPTPAEERKIARKQAEMRGGLTVPRRPAWTRATTRQELDRQERESFLEWRRSLAHLAEDSNLLLTPFERNIQLWRQLWRVLERSHLIVQIVDARNPSGFRSVDLERYVSEVGDDAEKGDDVTVPGKGKRRSLLLVNKADLLTYEQRCAWAEYFEEEGVRYAFFSASDAAAMLEQAERQRRREAGEYDEYADDGEDDDDDEEDEDAQDVETNVDEAQEDVDEEYASGEEVEPQSPVADVSKALLEADLSDDEEGWSTEGEDEGAAGKSAGPVEAALAKGRSLPLSQVAQAAGTEVESVRTRVLTVTELEDLFISEAPPLSEFATARDPNPTKLMVGLVGYPNVGKSSTINALLGAKKVSVSSTPGKTKHFQTLVLSDTVTLCDCPGLVFPQFANTQADMVCDGVLPIDQMREYSAPVDLVCRRITREILEGTYGIRIEVREIEDGGSGKVGWEELLSTYAIARGMTRSSFGMPDTSRAARHVLKDYVNARLLFAHPPPGLDVDAYMETSRALTVAKLDAEYEAGRKRAPTTHVGKNADTYVAPAGAAGAALIDAAAAAAEDEGEGEGEGAGASAKGKERQYTSRQVKASAASAPARSGRAKASALDGVFFTDAGPAPRPVVMGRRQGAADPLEESGGAGYSRSTMYPHQRRLGPDGMPMVGGGGGGGAGGNGALVKDKKHFRGREGKKRSGRGYD